MVKSEETCLFRSNCFVWMTSADHEVTTGKLAPWGGWNEISYQPACSSSFLHLVPFVICKAKEMFCAPWFFSPFFFFPSGKGTIHLTVSPKSQLLLQVCLVPDSEVNDLDTHTHTPPLAASHQTFAHPPLGSPETCFKQLENPKKLGSKVFPG